MSTRKLAIVVVLTGIALLITLSRQSPKGTVPAGTLNVTDLKVERFDEDFAVEAYLRDPYSMYCTQHCTPAEEKQQP